MTVAVLTHEATTFAMEIERAESMLRDFVGGLGTLAKVHW